MVPLSRLCFFSSLHQAWGHGEYQVLIKGAYNPNDFSNVCMFHTDPTCRKQDCGAGQREFNEKNSYSQPDWSPFAFHKSSKPGMCGGDVKAPVPSSGVCEMDFVDSMIALAGPGTKTSSGGENPAYASDGSMLPSKFKALFDDFSQYGVHGNQDGNWHRGVSVYICLVDPSNQNEPAWATTKHYGHWRLDKSKAEASTRLEKGCKYVIENEGGRQHFAGPNVETKFSTRKFFNEHRDVLVGKTWVLKLVLLNRGSEGESYTRCMTIKFSGDEGTVTSAPEKPSGTTAPEKPSGTTAPENPVDPSTDPVSQQSPSIYVPIICAAGTVLFVIVLGLYFHAKGKDNGASKPAQKSSPLTRTIPPPSQSAYQSRRNQRSSPMRSANTRSRKRPV